MEADSRTVAELTAVSNHPGFARVVTVEPHVETRTLTVRQDTLAYLQRVYDDTASDKHGFKAGYRAGIELAVLQLNLPIRIQH